jgi:NOL1/NOP2/fmu family ribosome biogenesis protein
VRVQSTLFDASQFSAAVEQAIDLLARQARAFARGEQEDRAVTVAALTKPSGQHQLLIQQRVLMLAKFFDSVQ